MFEAAAFQICCTFEFSVRFERNSDMSSLFQLWRKNNVGFLACLHFSLKDPGVPNYTPFAIFMKKFK